MNSAESRVLADFRARYAEASAHLDAFTDAYAAMTFEGWTVEQIGAWCREWWERRLAGRALEDAERKIRGAQSRN